jgi:hypothetical protein
MFIQIHQYCYQEFKVSGRTNTDNEEKITKFQVGGTIERYMKLSYGSEIWAVAAKGKRNALHERRK